MEILILLIPLSVFIALGIAVIFWWSADNGQFDDLESPGQKILMDDDGVNADFAKNRPNQRPIEPP